MGFFWLPSWYKKLPPKDKQSILTVLVFLAMLALFLALTITEKQFNDSIRRTAVFPAFVVKLSDLAAALAEEAQASITFSLQNTNVNLYQEMMNTRNATDAAYKASFAYIQSEQPLHSWDPNYPFAAGGTIMTEQGLQDLIYVRAQMTFGEVVFNPQVTRKRYLTVLSNVVGEIATSENVFKENVDYSALVEANVMMAAFNTFYDIQHSTQLYHYYGEQQATDPTAQAKATAELKNLLIGISLYQNIIDGILIPLLDLRGQLTLSAHTSAVSMEKTFETLMAEATDNQFLPSTFAYVEITSLAMLRDVLISLSSDATTKYKNVYESSKSKKFFWYIACCVLSGLAFLVSLVEFLYLRLFEARGSAVRRRNAAVMHDVLVRVSEYVDQIATFSLSPKPPPLTMSDKKVSIVEAEMKYLLGQLNSMAGTLPPMLFPDRLRALAAEYSEVKDPATMVLCPEPRENLDDEKVHLQTANARHPYLRTLAEKTDLQECVTEAALIFVSLTAFHDLGSADKRKFSLEYYQKIISLIEECVYQHGGLMQSVSFDKAVAVWSAAGSVNGKMEDAYGNKAGFCELAATCGLTLASRLGMLRTQKSLVRENFMLHIGIVGGTVNIGVFGTEEAKSICVFGPPVLRGMLVAQANGFHMSSVACDDYIRDAIQRMYHCKPIELLPCGGCAHQVLSESSRDQADLEMQLLTYTKAFELFERKHYKGALKAFRAYTKQYGYDSSVERIQQLIISMHA